MKQKFLTLLLLAVAIVTGQKAWATDPVEITYTYSQSKLETTTDFTANTLFNQVARTYTGFGNLQTDANRYRLQGPAGTSDNYAGSGTIIYAFTAKKSLTISKIAETSYSNNASLKYYTTYYVGTGSEQALRGSSTDMKANNSSDGEVSKTPTLTLAAGETIYFKWTATSEATGKYVYITNIKITAVSNVTENALTLTANPSGAGELTGAGDYAEGESVTLSATANSGYEFVNWTDASNNVLTDADTETDGFQFTMPAAATTLTANFNVLSPANESITNTNGAVSCTKTTTLYVGDNVTFTATPNEGYRFTGWTVNGEAAGNGDRTLTHTMAASDAIVATFAEDTRDANIWYGDPLDWVLGEQKEETTLGIYKFVGASNRTFQVLNDQNVTYNEKTFTTRYNFPGASNAAGRYIVVTPKTSGTLKIVANCSNATATGRNICIYNDKTEGVECQGSSMVTPDQSTEVLGEKAYTEVTFDFDKSKNTILVEADNGLNILYMEFTETSKYSKPTIAVGTYNYSTGYHVTISPAANEEGTITYKIGDNDAVTSENAGSITVDVPASTKVTASVSGSQYSSASDDAEATMETAPAMPVPTYEIGAYNTTNGTYPLTITATEGCSIRYNITGETTNWPTYKGTLNLAPGKEVIARNWVSMTSNSKTVTITIPAAPQLEAPAVAAGSDYVFTAGGYTVTMTAAEGATIKYTTDNWATENTYTEAINVRAGKTVKAKAEQANMITSEEASVTVSSVVPADGNATFKTSGAGTDDAEVKNIDNKTAYGTIAGNNIAGVNGTNGLKFRTGKTTSIDGVKGIEIKVANGVNITKVEWSGAISNYSTPISVKKCYVDGQEIQFTEKSLPASGSNAISFNVKGFNAKESIIFELGEEAAQYRASITVTATVPSYNDGVTAEGYGTMYYEKELVCPVGTKAYIGTLNGSTLTLTEIADGDDETNNVIPAYTPVVIKGNGGYFAVGTTGADAISSDLQGTATAISTPANAYVLGYTDSEKTCFYPYAGETIAANKAYLVCPSTAKGITFAFAEDAPTAIESVNNAQLTVNNGKFIKNGQLVIVKDGKQYNATGAQVK